jgi:AcrR family transcriptional regulator
MPASTLQPAPRPAPVKAANKHELRTRETRSLLLAAAETIFVRDGYEGAELGEIAALAGRTKGAIYAQFKSKEDIFLALIQDRTAFFRARMADALSRSTTIEGNLAALRQLYHERIEDKVWSLLILEFKLFALRHPEAKDRLRSHTAGAISDQDEARLVAILGPAPQGEDPVSRVIAVQTIFTAISALVLETQLDPAFARNDSMLHVVNRIFDALLDHPTP